MKNNSLREIAQVLHEAKSILLFPHVNLDGDALGSCAALCRTLRLQGKNVWIMLEDDIPANLRFLDRDTAHGIRIRSRSRTYVCAWTAAIQADFRAEPKNLPPERRPYAWIIT